uniref:Uncharacterized protein n=1 Tax=Rhizophora mucronata TaxID=61149 RepID=A0A2P2MZV3_RHIMU
MMHRFRISDREL